MVELDRKLAAIDSGYELHQVKEKFGGLRVYFHTEHGDLWDLRAVRGTRSAAHDTTWLGKDAVSLVRCATGPRVHAGADEGDAMTSESMHSQFRKSPLLRGRPHRRGVAVS